MSDILEKLKSEQTNVDSIHLYLEGMFWKAYQQSAYLFSKLYRPDFQVKCRYVKTAHAAVCSVGFPENSLLRIFCDVDIIKVSDNELCLTTERIEEKEYAEWQKAHEAATQAPSSVSECPDGKAMAIQRLSLFNLSSSSPIDCMMLVAELQHLLKA